MNISFKELVNKDFTESSIKRLITYTNADIMDFACSIITAQEIEEPLVSACQWFATSLYVTYHADKIQEMLTTIDEDSEQILESCANDEHLPDTRAYEIGTNSETNPNYSVMERMVLVCAAAKRLNYKFDFSWKS